MIPDDDELEKKERKKESSYIVSIIYLNLFYKTYISLLFFIHYLTRNCSSYSKYK